MVGKFEVCCKLYSYSRQEQLVASVVACLSQLRSCSAIYFVHYKHQPKLLVWQMHNLLIELQIQYLKWWSLIPQHQSQHHQRCRLKHLNQIDKHRFSSPTILFTNLFPVLRAIYSAYDFPYEKVCLPTSPMCHSVHEAIHAHKPLTAHRKSFTTCFIQLIRQDSVFLPCIFLGQRGWGCQSC